MKGLIIIVLLVCALFVMFGVVDADGLVSTNPVDSWNTSAATIDEPGDLFSELVSFAMELGE